MCMEHIGNMFQMTVGEIRVLALNQVCVIFFFFFFFFCVRACVRVHARRLCGGIGDRSRLYGLRAMRDQRCCLLHCPIWVWLLWATTGAHKVVAMFFSGCDRRSVRTCVFPW